MSLPRSFGESYIHAAAIVDDTPFPACDAILVLTAGNATFTLKTGATVALASLAANSILSISCTSVNIASGTYVALYK